MVCAGMHWEYGFTAPILDNQMDKILENAMPIGRTKASPCMEFVLQGLHESSGQSLNPKLLNPKPKAYPGVILKPRSSTIADSARLS